MTCLCTCHYDCQTNSHASSSIQCLVLCLPQEHMDSFFSHWLQTRSSVLSKTWRGYIAKKQTSLIQMTRARGSRPGTPKEGWIISKKYQKNRLDCPWALFSSRPSTKKTLRKKQKPPKYNSLKRYWTKPFKMRTRPKSTNILKGRKCLPAHPLNVWAIDSSGRVSATRFSQARR